MRGTTTNISGLSDPPYMIVRCKLAQIHSLTTPWKTTRQNTRHAHRWKQTNTPTGFVEHTTNMDDKNKGVFKFVFFCVSGISAEISGLLSVGFFVCFWLNTAEFDSIVLVDDLLMRSNARGVCWITFLCVRSRETETTNDDTDTYQHCNDDANNDTSNSAAR